MFSRILLSLPFGFCKDTTMPLGFDDRPDGRVALRPLDLSVKRRQPLAATGDGIDVFLHHDLLHRLLELDRLELTCAGLGLAAVAFEAATVPEQERQQPLPGRGAPCL
jgi:hypothetical protein